MSDHLVRDELEPCPYLEGEVARMPLRVPGTRVDRIETDRRLALGQRRAGEFLYDTQCPGCQQCVPIRLPVDEFEFSRNQRRILRRGDRWLRQTSGPLVADQVRVDLFNKHRIERGLNREREEVDLEDFRWGLVRSCLESFELSYWKGAELIANSICDRGDQALSAVYTYYDPDFSSWSLGTYSILKQIEWCQRESIRWLYLGYFVKSCRPMNYKTRFRPHEMYVGGNWQRGLAQPDLTSQNAESA